MYMTLDDYIDSDQEVSHLEKPDEWTHMIRVWFEDEVRCVYVLPTEDVHRIHNLCSIAGPILSVRQRRPDE